MGTIIKCTRAAGIFSAEGMQALGKGRIQIALSRKVLNLPSGFQIATCFRQKHMQSWSNCSGFRNAVALRHLVFKSLRNRLVGPKTKAK